MRLLNQVIFMFLLMLSVKAQVYQWAKGIGGAESDVGQAIAVDAEGNVYTTGYFSGTVDFDPGPGVVQWSSSGDRDIFILKTDKFGNLLWVNTFGGTSLDVPYSIALDNSGYFCVSGLFSETVDFDPGPNKMELVAEKYWDVFVAKFKFSGELIWAKRMGGLDGESGNALIIDSNKNIFITGYFNLSVDFNPGVGVNNLVSNGLNDIFICKLDSLGNYIWAKSIGGSKEDVATSITIDSKNNIGVTGFFFGSTDFDPGTGTHKLNSIEESRDIFIAKYDNDGTYLWAKSIGSDDNDQSRAITTDIDDHFYITGPFSDTVDFDPGPLNFTMISAGFQDIFISQFNPDGNHIWSKRIGGFGLDWGNAIIVDRSNGVYCIGFYSSTVDFDPNLNVYEFTSEGNRDIFVEKLNSAGEFVWAKSIGGQGNDDGSKLCINNSNDLYLTGAFELISNFNRPDSIKIISNGKSDFFIARYNQCINTSSTEIISYCDSYYWNGLTYDKSGSYVYKTKNSNGCDSIAVLDLVITKSDTAVLQIGNTLTAHSMGSMYQWLDCEDNYKLILAENNRIFSPTKSGNYAVEIRNQGCLDTSFCYSIILVNNNDADEIPILVFPNPFNKLLNIKLNEIASNIEINLFNCLGKKISNSTYYNTSTIQLMIDDSSGMYFLECIINGNQHILKRIKNQ
ncbi:MAG: SBBP repeat-containing protein [Saprospiraceae bacterium]|jgi:hypothetical protein|nr:SBBP repeat-containing protein [Saprospiraceae bacterium]